MIDLTTARKMLPHIVSLREFLKTSPSTSRSGYMWQLSAGLGVALAITAGAFKLYYDKSEAEKEAIALELRQSANNQLLLENSIKGLNEQVLRAEEDKKRSFEQISILQTQNDKAREEVTELKEKFAKHDMNMLSLRKPKLIENIINKGTKEVLGEFESITNPAPVN